MNNLGRRSSHDSIEETYRQRYLTTLAPAAAKLESLLKAYLEDQPRVDRISARAKSPERFIAKASKIQPDGSPKYTAPLAQIQDQIGARVIVFYGSDVERISKVIEKYYRFVERRDIVPEDHWKFGYSGTHYILALPADVVPFGTARDEAPEFFELQIKTLWQHAWSEANHDLGYKPIEQLSPDQQRKLAYTAAQAWGADMVFGQLFADVGGVS